jgi:hypothetical protein
MTLIPAGAAECAAENLERFRESSMRGSRVIAAAASVGALIATFAVHTADAPAEKLGVAIFTTKGELQRPTNMDQWVFLGTSLGMEYSETAKFNAENPGAFLVVLMEPRAYEYFRARGKYADGTMFALGIYGSEKQASIDRAGFSTGELRAYEVHVVDSQLPERHAFYPFPPTAAVAVALPAGNACVKCHLKDGGFDGTFTQFYPAIREQLTRAAGAAK